MRLVHPVLVPMFFSVARLRLALVPLLLLPLAAAHENVLRTSSVSYCSPPESIIVSQLDIAYFPSNYTVVFNISAASVSANTRVKADLSLNVYGMQPFTYAVDICSLLDGALCPLPLYDFNGADALVLPEFIRENVADMIPRIAYVMPDIEAFAQLTLTDVKTGEVRACLQTTLANNWSTHQHAVEWTTAVVVLFVTALAIWQTIARDRTQTVPNGENGTATNAEKFSMATLLLDIMSLFQTIALSGLLALNFPLLYRSFTLNFAWSLGLFAASSNSAFQDSIDRFRHHTGGHLPDSNSDGATPLVNRKLSPYNTIKARAFGLPEALSTATPANAAASLKPHVLVGGDVATVTADSSNVLQAGIPIYTNSIHISTANAFMTVFLIVLILLAITLASLVLVRVTVSVLTKRGNGDAFRRRFSSFACAWVLRIALITSLPLLVFALYQWTLKDSWMSVIFSVFILLVIAITVLCYSWHALSPIKPPRRRCRAIPAFTLPPDAGAPLTDPYDPHRPKTRYFFLLFLGVMVFKALVTAFVQSNGLAQIIIFFIIEFALLLTILIVRPYPRSPSQRRSCCITCWRGTSSLNGLAIYLAITRLVCHGLMIAFAESIAVKAIPRTAIGAIIAVLFSIAFLVLFFRTVIEIGLACLRGMRSYKTRSHSRSVKLSSGSTSSLESDKGGNELGTMSSRSSTSSLSPAHRASTESHGGHPPSPTRCSTSDHTAV